MSRLVVRAGDGDARLDGDLDGAGSDADLDGLAGAGQAGLDSVAAGHDGSADADPPGDGEAGQIAGTEPGRQGLDAVPAEQDADLAEPGPEPHGPARHGDTLPAGHLRPPQPGHERLGLVN